MRRDIILEATWLGHFEPHITAMVQSYIADMMMDINQTAFIQDYNLQPFPVRVLTKERTLCEKIMSLVRFSFSDMPIADLNNKVRHIYDIHKLLQDETTRRFFDSEEFEKLLLKVADDDVKSYRNNNAWLSNHPVKSILFSDTVNTWQQIRKTYNSDFKELVFGELPNEKDILATLNEVSNRLKSIKWTIE